MRELEYYMLCMNNIHGRILYSLLMPYKNQAEHYPRRGFDIFIKNLQSHGNS